MLEPNQKSNGLSINRESGQRFTTDDRRIFTKVLGANKGASTPGNNNDVTCENTGGPDVEYD